MRRRRLALWWGTAAVVSLSAVIALWVANPEVAERSAVGAAAPMVAGLAVVITIGAVAVVWTGPPASGLIRWVLALCTTAVSGGGVGVLGLTSVIIPSEFVDLGAGVALLFSLVGMNVVATQLASKPVPVRDSRKDVRGK